MKLSPRVLVSIVTYNDTADARPCVEAVRRQTLAATIRVFDNASLDRSADVMEALGVSVVRSSANIGFSAGHNRNIQDQEFDYALFLNPDCHLTSEDHIERLVHRLRTVDRAGMAGGKLLRMDQAGAALLREGHRVIDSAGIYFTPELRHFDRGAGEPDRGQYDEAREVFGITGAALLCSREFIQDVSCRGEFLDEDFFAFREDADLAWRAQLLGWKAVYEPAATALHRRSVLPERRGELDPFINRHSLKNRYLMRMKNMDGAVRRRCFPYCWMRDLGIAGYVLLRERSSLGAYRDAWRLRRLFAEKRADLRSRRRASEGDMARWFSFRPVTFPLE